jgi:hypothetical protein
MPVLIRAAGGIVKTAEQSVPEDMTRRSNDCVAFLATARRGAPCSTDRSARAAVAGADSLHLRTGGPRLTNA